MQKNTLQKLLDNSNEILCTLNKLGHFIWLNNTAKKYFGVQTEAISTILFAAQFRKEDQAFLKAVIDQINTTPSKELSFQSLLKLKNKGISSTWSLIWNEEEQLLYCLAVDKTEQNLTSATKNYHLFFDNSPSPKLIYSFETFQIIDVNEAALITYGYTKQDFLKLSLKDLICTRDFVNFELAHKDLNQFEESKHLGIFNHIKNDGTVFKLDLSGQNFSMNNGCEIILTCLDVTEGSKINELEHLENEILEKVLDVEPDLYVLFENYIKGLERIFPEMKATIVKVNDEKLWDFVSYSLPTEYKTAIDGLPIGPNVGSCGTSAYLKKRVISADISTDPLWEDFKALVLPLGLKACWSQPIFNSKSEVIAVFTNFFSTKRTPTSQELKVFERSASIVGIIFENQENNTYLQSKIDQFSYVNQATNDAIYDWNVKADTIYWGEGYLRLFGYEIGDKPSSFSKWKSLVHPNDLERTLKSLNTFMGDATKKRWQANYRFEKADGTYSFVEDKGFAIRGIKGDLIRMSGVLSDVSKVRIDSIVKEVSTEIYLIFKDTVELKAALEQTTKLLLNYGGYCISELWIVSSNKSELNLFAKSSNKVGDKFYTASNKLNILQYGEGLPGEVWKEQQILSWNYNEINKKCPRKKAFLKANLKKMMGIPLIRQGEVIGVWLCAESKAESNSFEVNKKIGLDIAANLASEINRKQLEEGLTHIFDLSPDIICTMDCQGNFKRINKAGLELLEYSEEELLKMSYNQIEYFPNTGIKSDEAQISYDQRKTYRSENRYLTKSGKTLWLDWNCHASFEEGLIYAVVKDITKKKELQDLINDASKMALVGSWELDLINNNIYWSNITREIHEAPLGYEPDLDTAINFYRKDKRGIVQKAIDQAINKGISWDFELPIISYMKNEKWIRCIGRPEIIGGECTRIFGSFQDINKQKSNEIRLNSLLIEKQSILERINDSFIAMDTDFNIIYWNKAAEKATGLLKKDLIGKNVYEIFPGAESSPTYNTVKEALEKNNTVNYERFYEPLNRWFDVTVHTSNTGISVYFKDISEKKLAQEKIRITNIKLREIAWEQSHSVRAPVARLMTIIDLIKHGELNTSEKEELFKNIITSAEEIDVIIRDISEKTNEIDFKMEEAAIINTLQLNDLD